MVNGSVGVHARQEEIPDAEAIATIAGLLRLPKPKGYCGGSKPMRLRSREAAREKVMRMSCRSWKCLVCRDNLKRRAGLHFGLMLMKSRPDWMLFEAQSPPEAWQADQKRLKRMKAEWVRIGCAGETAVLIGSAKPPFGAAIPDWQMAVARLGDALRSLVPVWPNVDDDSRCRPISCSRGWTPPKHEQKWERIGFVRVSKPEPLADALRALGMKVWIRPADEDGRLWDVSYEAPLMDEERMAELEAALAEMGGASLCRDATCQ